MAASTLRAQHPAGGRLAPRADSPQRVWAKANLRGLMNLFLPTFREDGRTLDEDAIRHDVRHAIAQGFSGTLPMINWTLPGDPRWMQFHRILIDEAGDDLPVHGIIASGKVESDLRLLGALESRLHALALARFALGGELGRCERCVAPHALAPRRAVG